MRPQPLLSVLLLLLLVMAVPACHDEQQEQEFVLLYTGDVRGNFLGYNYKKNVQSRFCLGSFKSLVDESRGRYGDHCLAFDIGGRTMGSPNILYYRFFDTLTTPLYYRVCTAIGYDAMGLGLAEHDDPELLSPRRHDPAKLPPIVCANFVSRTTREPVFQPYRIFDRDGVRIALLGVTSPDGSMWQSTEEWSNVEIQDETDCVRQWAPEMLRHRPDLMVGMFYADTLTPEQAAPFDVVLLCGRSRPRQYEMHTHANHYTQVLGVTSDAQTAGMVRVHMQRQEGDHNAFAPRPYTKILYTALINLSQFERDADFEALFRPATDTVRSWFNRPVGYLADEIYGGRGIFRCDYYRRLVHWAQLEYTGADISMASVQIPNDTIPPGPISMRVISTLYPSYNQLIILRMRADEVRRYLEWGYANQYVSVETAHDDPLLYRKDKFGRTMRDADGAPRLKVSPVHFTSAGGINYEVDLSRPAGQRVRLIDFEDGRPILPDTLYRVCIDTYQASDAGRFISEGLKWNLDTLHARCVPSPAYCIRQILYNQAARYDTLRVPYVHNWTLIPDGINRPPVEHGFHAVW